MLIPQLFTQQIIYFILLCITKRGILFFRGTEEHFGLPPGRVDIINSTLGKALGGAAGGYTTGPKELVTLLRQRARPYLFSNSIPPPVVACANKVSVIFQKYNSKYINELCKISLWLGSLEKLYICTIYSTLLSIIFFLYRYLTFF